MTSQKFNRRILNPSPGGETSVLEKVLIVVLIFIVLCAAIVLVLAS